MDKLTIRKAEQNDLQAILELYTHLHGDPAPEEISEYIKLVWTRIIYDPCQQILLGCIGKVPVSSCVVVMVENLTHDFRPYALVENVVTHADHRGRGYATQVLDAAKAFAQSHNCYKIMLMTGAKDPGVLDFYRRAGYNSEDKTAMIQWLDAK